MLLTTHHLWGFLSYQGSLPPFLLPVPLQSGEAAGLTSVFTQRGGWEAEAQAGLGLGSKALVCHRGLFPLTQAQSWHRKISWLTCFFFPLGTQVFINLFTFGLQSARVPGKQNLSASQEEKWQKREILLRTVVRSRNGTPLPQQNPSSSSTSAPICQVTLPR